MCAKLDEFRLGICLRRMINTPPKHLKSFLASVAFPVWVLAHDPGAEILCISYGREPADKFARDRLKLFSAPFLKDAFPELRLSTTRPAIANIRTTQNGGCIATTVEGALTGLSADYIIVDDPMKAGDAQSAVRRKFVNEEFAATLPERFRDKRTGRIILVGHRVHEDDTFGFSQGRGGDSWDLLSLAAIAEEPQTFVWQTIYGTFEHYRAIGDLLHPEREPLEVLQAIRASEGEYHWASRYQQQPAPAGGGLVKEQWFKRYREDELPDSFDFKIQSWDTANLPGESSDYSVCTTLGVKGDKYYLIDLWRKRVGFSDLKRAVMQQRNLHRPSKIIIEERASGVQLLQVLREDGVEEIVAYQSRDDKTRRFNAQTSLIEQGRVYLPLHAPWLPECLHELKTFPKSRYDDQVDSISQGLDWLRRNSRLWTGCADFINSYAPYVDYLNYNFAPAGYLRKNPDQVLMRTRRAVAYQDINGKFHYLSAGDTIAVSRECAAGLASSINWELA